MKKILLFITMSLLVACSTDEIGVTQSSVQRQSRYISKEDAQKQVYDILYGNGGATRSDGFFDGKNVTSSFTHDYTYYINGKQQNSNLYVFNFGDNDGYAAILSDIKTSQLLMLTDEGKLEADDPDLDSKLPPINFRLEEPDTIDHEYPYPEDPYEVYCDWEVDTVKYGWYSYPTPSGIGTYMEHFGLVKVRWGQEYPYNKYLTEIDGQLPPTGCVVTALAMLLSYYQYPVSFGGYTFNWSEMTKVPKVDNLSETYQNQVARLMQVLGEDYLDADYNLDGTSSDIDHIPGVLQSLGYYYNGMTCAYDLDNVLYDINFGNPVIVQGKPGNDENGHAWIMDAYLRRRREVKHYSAEGGYLYSTYQTRYFLHCLWGMEEYGSSFNHDGFFLNNYFNPGDNPAIYANSHGSWVLNNNAPTPYYVCDLKMLHHVSR